MPNMPDRTVVRTRHVLAVKDLAVEAAYYIDKLGFERDFTAPGWEFLSFGDFKVMLGECADDLSAVQRGVVDHVLHLMGEPHRAGIAAEKFERHLGIEPLLVQF